MYKCILYCTTLLFLLFHGSCYSQSWTWVNGSNLSSPQPVFGTQGVATSSNSPGGRGYATGCFDAATGAFWLFGGWSSPIPNNQGSCYSQDLWKYELATNQWTWMKGPTTVNAPGVYGTQGVPAPSNNPGGRTSGVMWSDGAGNLWLFGGFGYVGTSLGSFNDLWRYTIATNEWTWMKGSNQLNSIGNYGTQGTSGPLNNPPARHGARAFKDPQGNLCFFAGGSQYPITNILQNDIWKYTIATNEWTWVKGSSVGNQFGTYGTQGVPSPANNPGGRSAMTLWQDANSDLWVFGGGGFSSNASGYLNDLWKYEWNSNSWTWITGNDQLVDQPGIYGTMGISATANLPGARWGCASWTDNAGDLWLLGGIGYISGLLSTPELNDLWKYEVSTNTFVWKKGTNTAWSLGNYGTQGVASPANYPSGREQSQYWKDASGNFWLFGGQGVASAPWTMGIGENGDVWRLPQCTVSIVPITSSKNIVCEGGALILSASGAATYTWSNSQTTSSTVVWPVSSSTYSLNGDDTLGCSYTSTIAIAVTPNLLGIVSTKSIICAGESAALTATGCIAYNWNTQATTPSITVWPTTSTSYQVSGFDASGCTFYQSYFVAVSPCTGIASLTDTNKGFSVFPNPASDEFFIETESASELVLVDALGQTLMHQSIEAGNTRIHLSDYAPGIYYLYFNTPSCRNSVKVIKQ